MKTVVPEHGPTPATLYFEMEDSAPMLTHTFPLGYRIIKGYIENYRNINRVLTVRE